MTIRARLAHWRWLWLPLALMVTLAGWAVSSPVGSSPDDDFHLSSIWCSTGDQACSPTMTDGQEALLVARNVAQAADCYRYDEAITADCTTATAADTTLVAVSHVNQIEGLYPTGYYRVMSLLASDDVERSVVLMRLANILLVGLLLALLLRTAPASIGFATSAAMAVTLVPLGLFILASTNPSAWAVSGVVLFWGFALALLRRSNWRSRRTWLLACGTVVTGAMALAARVDAAAYLAVAAVLVLVIAGPRSMRRRLPAALLVAGVGAAGFLTYATFPTPGGGAGGETMGTASRGLGLLLTNAVHLPVLFEGVLGAWGLGWNDTPMPPFVPFAGVVALGGVLWAGLSRLWPAKTTGVAIATAALVLAPLWFLQKEGLGVGEVVQPRYLLPLLGLLVATVLVSERSRITVPWPPVPAWVIGLGLGLSGALAFWANTHRYAYGPEVGLFDIRIAPAWVGPFGVSPVLIAVTVAAATLLWTAASLVPPRASLRGSSRTPL